MKIRKFMSFLLAVLLILSTTENNKTVKKIVLPEHLESVGNNLFTVLLISRTLLL